MKTEHELRAYHEERINKCLGNYGPNPDSHPGFLHLDHMKAAYEESKNILLILDKAKLMKA